MERLGLSFDRIVASPLVRARETAAIVAEVLGGPAVEESETLAPGASPETSRGLLVGAPPSLLLVGHEPHLSTFIGYLTGGAVRMKKGSLAKVSPDPQGGTLCWLLTSRQLRLIGRT